MDPQFPWIERLQAALHDSDPTLSVQSVDRLYGGACQDNFTVRLQGPGETFKVALRCDAASSLPGSLSRAQEYPVIAAARAKGVPTPRAWLLTEGMVRDGAAAYLMDWVEGIAIGAKVTRDPRLEAARAALPQQLADALARIHQVRRDAHPELQFDNPQSAGERSPTAAALYFCRQMMDEMSQPRPALEFIVRWLEDHAPPDDEVVLVHGDYRTGNFMVGPDGLQAVLDWEFAHWGSPEEDLGWLMVRDWRFGRLDKAAGGFADREAFLSAYEAASGRSIDRAVVRWWEILGNARWATGAVFQTERVLSGKEKDVELLAIGRRALEMEYEGLRLIGEA